MRQLGQSSARKKLYVPRMLAWNRHLRAWRNVSRQQDATEFWAHLMLESEPDILARTWESRRQVGDEIQVSDSAFLWQPIQIAVQANTLQSIVDLWQAQTFPHALVAETPCVLSFSLSTTALRMVLPISCSNLSSSGRVLSCKCQSLSAVRASASAPALIVLSLPLFTRACSSTQVTISVS